MILKIRIQKETLAFHSSDLSIVKVPMSQKNNAKKSKYIRGAGIGG